MARRPTKLDRQLDRLRALGDAGDAEAIGPLEELLGDSSGIVVSQAAHAVQTRGLRELRPALRAAFDRLLIDPVKRDPGCLGKHAALEALDHLDETDPDVFLRAVRLVQLEPAYGASVDTAGGVRSRGGAALARLGHDDALLALARLVGDPIADVRRAALETLAYHADRAGAAVALHKLMAGDEDPMVVAAAVGTLLALAPDFAAAELRPRLLGGDDDDQELVSVTLGQSNSEVALDLLVEWFEEAVLATERALALAAIGLHRSDRARQFLLDRVADGSHPVARAAIEALSIHRYDDRLRRQALDAAGESAIEGLTSEVDRAFADEG